MKKTSHIWLGNRHWIAARFAVFVLASVSLAAQWVNYPTPGIPKTPSGLPNLGAPTPRTPDGRPDFSGMWEAENTLPCDPKDGGDNCTDIPIGIKLLDIATGLKDGLPYQPWAAALAKKRSAEMEGDSPTTHCLPAGVPRMHTQPEFKKYVQLPVLLVIMIEYNATYRQIFLDGRPLPADPQPSWNGYSTGHWEGDALVVETNGLRDMWLDLAAGNPITEAAKVTERFRRLNYGNMEIELTVDDPKAYTKPWTVKLNQYIVLNTEMLDYHCLENEKDAAHMPKAK